MTDGVTHTDTVADTVANASGRCSITYVSGGQVASRVGRAGGNTRIELVGKVGVVRTSSVMGRSRTWSGGGSGGMTEGVTGTDTVANARGGCVITSIIGMSC